MSQLPMRDFKTVTPKQWEASAADKRGDAMAARMHNMTGAQYERSGMDAAADKAQMASKAASDSKRKWQNIPGYCQNTGCLKT